MTRHAIALTALAAALACGGDGVPESGTGPKLGQSAAAAPPCASYLAPNCPPYPTVGPNVVTGVVVERTSAGTRPVGIIEIQSTVRTSGSAFWHPPVYTDAAGRFRLDDLPNGAVEIYAGRFQPCATIVSLTGGGASVTVELSPPSPSFATEPPVVSGRVFERSPNGPAPIAGAVVVIYGAMDSELASTATDAQGRFALCRVPAGASLLNVRLPWIQPWLAFTLTIPGDSVLDIEVRR